MSADAATDPEIGAVIADRYRVVELLGRGGMGAVYRAEHLQLGKAVAIKMLRPEISNRSDSDARFQREALAGARLQHPNIVGVLDFGNREDGTLFLVMELLAGESLRELLDRENRLPWPRALHIARQVLRALDHAHAQGVIHRDIKPANIQLTRDGDLDHAKLIDFGIAMLTAGEGSDVKLTAAGLAVGTPTYLAPEQAVGGKLGPPSDLYSLSVVLFEMLSGRPPFVADDEPVKLLSAHAMAPPPRIAEVAPDAEVPPEIELILRRGLAKTWGDRIASASEYTALLDQIRRHRADLDGDNPDVARYQTPPPTPVLAPSVNPPVGATPPASPSLGLAPTAIGAATPAPARRASSRWRARLRWRPTRRHLVALAGAGAAALGLAVALMATSSSGGSSGIALPAMVISPLDREARLKALTLDLQEGKTCNDRRAAVFGLAALGDERAIPVLKRARYRMRGGVLGIGDSNTNSCLRKDAEAAIRALGGELR